MSLKPKIQKTKSQKLKFYMDKNFSKTEMSTKLKFHQTCHQNWNVTEKKKLHQNWSLTKTEMLQETGGEKMKCPQNWNITETEMSTKLKCHPNWNVTRTEMSPKLKGHKNWYIPISQCHKNLIWPKLKGEGGL